MFLGLLYIQSETSSVENQNTPVLLMPRRDSAK